MGVLLHVLGDAANNLGVIISALVIWLTHYDGRYYADPAVSMAIAVMILLSSLPLGIRSPWSNLMDLLADQVRIKQVRRSGVILLESVPNGVDLGDVKHDLEKVRLSCTSLVDESNFACRSPVSSPSTNCMSGASTSKSPSHLCTSSSQTDRYPVSTRWPRSSTSVSMPTGFTPPPCNRNSVPPQ